MTSEDASREEFRRCGTCSACTGTFQPRIVLDGDTGSGAGWVPQAPDSCWAAYVRRVSEAIVAEATRAEAP